MVPTVGWPTNTPVVVATATPGLGCKQCPSTFGCYQYVNGSNTEYRWFVPGYVSLNFVKISDQTCINNSVAKPTFKGKENADANCDGYINGADYSIWRREYIDISQTEPVVRSTWEADFNCDKVVNGYDFSLWNTRYHQLLGQ
jgi:hypothetical protein